MFLKKNCLFYFFLIIALIIPIILQPNYILSNIPSFYDDKRLIELLTINLFLITLILNKSSREIFCNTFQALSNESKSSLFLILGFIVLSSFLSKNQNISYLQLSLYLGLFFLIISIASLTRLNVNLIQIIFLTAIFTSLLLYLINTFVVYLASFIENIPMKWPEPFNGFSNIRFFNQYQIWSISLLSLPLIIYPSVDKRIIKLIKAIAIGWTILLFASGSRGAVGSIILSMLVTLFIFRGYAKLYLKLNSLFLIAGFIGYILLFKLIPYLAESDVTIGWRSVEGITSSSGRIELWQYAIQYIIDSPWLGIGPMHYAYYPGPTHAHPHNSLLQWACEMGIPSTLLVLSLIFSGLYNWVKKFYILTNSESLYVPSHLWIGLFCTLCSGLIYSLVSGVIVMPLSQVMIALIIGWMLGIYFQDQESKPVSQLQHIGLMLLAGATLTTLIYTVLPSLLPRLYSYADLPYQDYPIIAPRFWQIGGIPH